jgi:hypothetical protein
MIGTPSRLRYAATLQVEVLWTSGRKLQSRTRQSRLRGQRPEQYKSGVLNLLEMEAPSGFEPEMEVLQISQGSLVVESSCSLVSAARPITQDDELLRYVETRRLVKILPGD